MGTTLHHSQQLCVETTAAVNLNRSLPGILAHNGLLLHPELTKPFLRNRLPAVRKTVQLSTNDFRDIEIISRSDSLLKEDRVPRRWLLHIIPIHMETLCLSFGTCYMMLYNTKRICGTGLKCIQFQKSMFLSNALGNFNTSG